MSKGYCVLAQTAPWVEMSITMARSLRLNQTEDVSITLITNDKVSDDVFDHVVEIPWYDHAAESNHKMDNTWKYFWASPYDETIVLSPDMIVPSDIAHWWHILGEKDMWFPTSTKDFSGKDCDVMDMRNDSIIPMYSNLFYFRKSDLAAEFFCMLEQVYHNWQLMYDQHLDNKRPTTNKMSVSYSLTSYLIDRQYELTEHLVTDIPTFVQLNKDSDYEGFPVYKNRDDELYMSNFKQHLPIHYRNYEIYNKLGLKNIYG